MQLDLFTHIDPAYTGAKPSATPIRTVAQLEAEHANKIRKLDHQRLQNRLPLFLQFDQWELWKDPEGYRVFHQHTGFETEPFFQHPEAIDQALTIAAYFEILPRQQLWDYARTHGEPRRRLPAAMLKRLDNPERYDRDEIIAKFSRRERSWHF